MKDRVTLTLEKSLLKQIDASIDGTNIKNRSHAVEMLLYDALEGDLPKHAVILGGANPDHQSAVLSEVDGSSIIEQNVELLSSAGIKHIIIISTHSENLKKHLGDGSKWDIELQYVTESSPMGTAGALHLVKPYLTGPFILTNGDEFKQIEIRDIYQFHKEHSGWCTIALTTVPDPTEYGVALLNGSRIVTFVEKPSLEHAPSNLISAGFYLLDPEVLELIPNGYAKIEYDIFPKLAKEDKLYGYHFSGQYIEG